MVMAKWLSRGFRASAAAALLLTPEMRVIRVRCDAEHTSHDHSRVSVLVSFTSVRPGSKDRADVECQDWASAPSLNPSTVHLKSRASAGEAAQLSTQRFR